jgi:CRP/FNR family transcriptional regulator, cyclic AMP receptor protein
MKTERSNNAARLHAPSPVPGNEVAALNGPFHAESYGHGEVIYRPGDAADRIYLVKSGRVRLLRQGKGGSRAVLGILREGDLFGELLRPEEAVMEELAVAAGETLVWSIGSHDFRGLLDSRPGLALDIIRGLNERMRRMRSRLLGLTFKEVPARLAELLLVLAETHGDPCPHGGELDLKVVTQQDLADLLGASRSFVSTQINEMKRDGLLGNVGRTLCLRDQKALRKLASKER